MGLVRPVAESLVMLVMVILEIVSELRLLHQWLALALPLPQLVRMSREVQTLGKILVTFFNNVFCHKIGLHA